MKTILEVQGICKAVGSEIVIAVVWGGKTAVLSANGNEQESDATDCPVSRLFGAAREGQVGRDAAQERKK